VIFCDSCFLLALLLAEIRLHWLGAVSYSSSASKTSSAVTALFLIVACCRKRERFPTRVERAAGANQIDSVGSMRYNFCITA